jgi:O-antigen/teichoic acid export membrane protein
MNLSGRLRELAGQSFVYGLGGLVSRGVGIVLLPVYIHHVSRAQFGAVELIMASITLATIVFRFGLLSAMFRFSFDHPDLEYRARTVQTTFTAIMALATAAVVLGLVFLEPLSRVLGGRELTLIGLTGLWVSMNYDIMAGVYRIEQRPRAFVVYSLANVIITVLLTIVLVVPLGLEASGLMIGNFSGTYIAYAAMLIARRGTVGFRLFDRDLLRKMLHFAVPLMPAGLALWALNVADRFQVKYLASPADLGSYSVASKIALAVMLLIAAFQTAWPAFANSMPTEEETKRVYRAVMTYWAIVMGWAVVAISMLTPTYVHVTLKPDVWDAIPVVPMLMFGSVLYGMYMIVNAGVNRSRRTHFTPVVTGVAAAVNVGLNFYFIPRWGIAGAGATTVIGYVILLYLGWRNAQHSYAIDYEWRRVTVIGAVTAVFATVSVEVLPATGAGISVLRAALALAFPAVLVAVGVFNADERRRMFAMAAGIRRRRAQETPAELLADAAEEEPVA